MAKECDIAEAIIKIARKNRGVCTFEMAYRLVPQYVDLDAGNLEPSTTRPGEVMWQQLVRNIRSHHRTRGNYINRGLLVHIPRIGYRLP